MLTNLNRYRLEQMIKKLQVLDKERMKYEKELNKLDYDLQSHRVRFLLQKSCEIYQKMLPLNKQINEAMLKLNLNDARYLREKYAVDKNR